MDLENSVVVITGGTRMGCVVARELAGHGGETIRVDGGRHLA